MLCRGKIIENNVRPMQTLEIRNLVFINYKSTHISTSTQSKSKVGQVGNWQISCYAIRCHAMPCRAKYIASNSIEIKTDIFGLYRSTANRLGEQCANKQIMGDN